MKYRTKWGKRQKKKVLLPHIKVEDGNIVLTGALPNHKIAEIFEGAAFNEARFLDFKLIDLAVAREIGKAAELRSIANWSKITRPAFSRLIQFPGLKEAFVFDFAGAGRLRDFHNATEVETLRSSYVLTTADIFEIANLPKLHTLFAQFSAFGLKAVQRICDVQTLRVVDFEGVTFSQDMTKALSASRSLTHLGLPATQLNRTSLIQISEMSQLIYLDIWANGFDADDLDILAGHPSLEIIELGGDENDVRPSRHASAYIPKLEKLPALTTVYFDGVKTTDEEAAYLSSRYKFRLC